MKSMFEQEKIMDYKKLIIEMLDKLDSEQLKPVYFFIRGMLGEKQNGVYEEQYETPDYISRRMFL